MGVVIALLRAVNVGGRTLTSAQLKAVAAASGYREAVTYVNSGNLVAVADSSPDDVAAELSRALSDEAGFAVRVVARSAERWARLVERLPFPDEARDDPSHLVAVCWDGPAQDGAADFVASKRGGERLVWDGDVLYAYYPDGIGRSKLTLAILEKAAGRTGTARNWNTVLALARLADERR